MTGFPHLATLLFDRPLAIQPAKAEVILAALSGRLGVARLRLPDGRVRIFDSDGGQVVTVDMPDDEGPGYAVISGVAIIPVYGVLVQRQLGLRPISGMTGYNAIRQNFCLALDDPQVRAIAFDIDSPGGAVAGGFDLTDEICAARGSKPMWSILNETAASAAFAIAAAADKVVVPRTGYAGSIGVVVLHADVSRALDREGVTVSIITSGSHKSDDNPAIPLSDPARAALQRDVDTIGELFISTIARYRGLSTARVRDQQAAVYLGRDGIEAGLCDAVMSPAEAFHALVRMVAPAPGPRLPSSRNELFDRHPSRAGAAANVRRLRRLGIMPPMAS